MAVCKKEKRVKQVEQPKGKSISRRNEPEAYYSEHPAWSFAHSDKEQWTFSKLHLGNAIWDEVIPALVSLESQTWSNILVASKKNHHSINPNRLSKDAQKRLVELHIEAEAIISLRLNGKHRLYGYMVGHVFHILWYDDNHGDNDSCVCQSRRKHT